MLIGCLYRNPGTLDNSCCYLKTSFEVLKLLGSGGNNVKPLIVERVEAKLLWNADTAEKSCLRLILPLTAQFGGNFFFLC